MRMRKLSTFIFFTGIFMATLGFLAQHATNFPSILRLLTPGYHNATLGMTRLVEKGELVSDDQGFSIIEALFLDVASSQNPPEVINAISVSRITRMNASVGFSEKRAREVRPLEFELSNGQKVKWNIDSLQSEIDSLLKKGLFRYAFLLFALGGVMEILGFFVGRQGNVNQE